MLKIATDIIEIEGKNYEVIDFDEIDQNKYHGFIYVTVNLINNKKYVGQHTTWNKNYLGSGRYFINAVNKYGEENFVRYIIDLAESQEELDGKETFYINEEFNATECRNTWYNIKDGAQNSGNPYAGFTEEEMKETRRKMSKSHKGKILSKEHREKIGKASKGRTHTEEARKKISKFHKGKILSEETRKKISESTKKQWLDPELREKMSEISKNLWLDSEYRRKNKAFKGKTHTEETRKKMSESHKGNQYASKAVVIFKDGKYLNEFNSIISAAKYLAQTTGGSLGGLKNGIRSILNDNWVLKQGQLKGYSAMYLLDYEKLQEDPSKLRETLKKMNESNKDHNSKAE